MAVGGATLTNTNVLSNTTDGMGGGIQITRGAVLNGGSVVGNTAKGGSGGGVNTDGGLVISGTAVHDNTASQAGGGLYVIRGAALTETSVLSNTAGTNGGGVWVYGATTMVTSTLSGNVADGMGGGLYVVQGSVHVAESTLNNNVADAGGGGVALRNGVEAAFSNVTLAANRATGTSSGGGIHLEQQGTGSSSLDILHCTLVDNVAALLGGGLLNLDASVTLTNTLVAKNTVSGTPAGRSDISGVVTSGGGNLIGDVTGCTGIVNGVNGDQNGSALSPLDPLLGLLGDYGGGTETVPLLPSSPAIDKGTGPGAPVADQRGVTRDALPDVGAFESQGFWLSVKGGSGQGAGVETAFAELLTVDVNSYDNGPVTGAQVTMTAPVSGASATLSPASPVTVTGSKVSVTATANDVVGSYQVVASMPGVTSVYFDLSNMPDLVFSGGPARLCPGHNLYYALLVTNTSATASMHDLIVTGTVPAGAWYNHGDASGSATGVYDPTNREIVWTVAELAAGQQAAFDLILHTWSTLLDGATITESMTWASDELAGGTEQIVSVIDSTGCGPLPSADLTITGHVFGGSGAVPSGHTRLLTLTPIPGAIITATSCVDSFWTATTDTDGAYAIVIPGDIVEACEEVTLDVAAAGYGAGRETYTMAALRSNPVRDFVLDPWSYVWLPIALQ